MFFILLMGLIGGLILCLIAKAYSYPHPRFPPGYIGIPFVGFLFQFVIAKNYTEKLLKMKRKYGPICSVQMGSFKTVWLNDYDVIREDPAFAGRPLVPGVLERSHGFKGGIIFNDGEDFIEQQKFIMKALRDFGFGRKSMETLIVDEALELIEELKGMAGKPISTRHKFSVISLNALAIITTGRRYALDDPAMSQLTKILIKNLELNDGAKIAFFIPWLAKYFPRLIGWKAYLEEAQEIFDFWHVVAQERIQNYAVSRLEEKEEEINNFVDAYIKQIMQTTDPKSSFYAKNGELSLAATLQDLFIAGSETVSTTLSWLFLYLAVFPKVQEKLLREVDSVIGCGPTKILPKLADRLKLPYLECVLLETMRFGTLTPLGFIHRTMSDVEFHGYFIPKDTIVLPNISSVHFDKGIWKDPEHFRPERFLSPDGLSVDSSTSKLLLSFGHGKRRCSGMQLGKDELFLFASSILQEFSVSLDPAGGKPNLNAKQGVSATPRPHKLVFNIRY